MPGVTQRVLDPTIEDLVGLKLREIRKRYRLRQIDLAQQSGILRGTIATIETGRQGIPVTTLVRLAHALQVHPGTLLPDEHEVQEVRVAEQYLAQRDEARRRLAQIRSLLRQWDREDADGGLS